MNGRDVRVGAATQRRTSTLKGAGVVVDVDAKSIPPWAADLLASLPLTLDRPAAAKVAHCSLRTLDRRMRAGQLEFVRHGARVVVPRGALVAMLVGSAVASAA